MVQHRVEGAEVLERPASRLLVRRGGLTFGWESCRVLFREPNVADLLQAHWEELQIPGGLTPPLDPDFERFIQLEDLGLFRVWAARDGGTLVGYLAFFIQTHLHYRQTLHAVEDLFMLSAPYRRGGNGSRMFVTALDALRELGVKRVIVHTKVHFEAERGGLSKFFERLGFLHTDQLWIKVL